MKEANQDDWVEDGRADMATDKVAGNSDTVKPRTPLEGAAKPVKRITSGAGRPTVTRLGGGGP